MNSSQCRQSIATIPSPLDGSMATSISFQEQIEIPCFGSLTEFRQWAASTEFPDKVRVDYISGRIEVDLSPEDLFTHGNLKTKLSPCSVRC